MLIPNLFEQIQWHELRDDLPVYSRNGNKSISALEFKMVQLTPSQQKVFIEDQLWKLVAACPKPPVAIHGTYRGPEPLMSRVISLAVFIEEGYALGAPLDLLIGGKYRV